MTTQSRSLRLADQLSASPYAWPGGYPLYGIFSDGWQLLAIDANWEDPSLFCDHCGDRIESAYAEDQAE